MTKEEKSIKVYKLLGELLSRLGTFLVDALILMCGWNLLLTQIFTSLPQITFGKAIVLMMLSGILFKQHTFKTVD